MKSFKVIIAIAAIGLTALIATSFTTAAKKSKPANKGFAVVELFTSEGCSSCPPADDLVAKVEKEDADKPVYILAFHVDYWNRLGWTDVFSTKEYSQRQSLYSRWMHQSSVYTPQIVVNGKTQFVGSEEGTLHNAINAGLSSEPKETIALTDIKANHHKATLQYHISNSDDMDFLILALVQKHAQSVVKAGENEGHTLSHVQIVRDLQTIQLNKKNNGSATINLPDNFDQQKWEVIALVQSGSDGTITAATRETLAPAGS